jgi:hypothetical protein
MDRLDFFLAAERWGGLFLLLSALVAPIVLPVGALAAVRRRPRPRLQGSAVATGCLAALLYTPLALFFAVCHGAYVGDAPRAQVGFQWAEPVVAALERYRHERGTYPDSLAALVPRYLESPGRLELPERGEFSQGPRFERDGDGYELSFEYHGPGVNRCRYRSAERRWACGGYF